MIMIESDILGRTMTKSKKTTNWLSRHKKDPFVKKSKTDNYRSRAVYKLIEINNKYKILAHSQFAIDLGCAPGSWLQYLSEQKHIKKIIGIDVLDIKPIHRTDFIRADIANPGIIEKIQSENKYKAGVVLSDIAPNISGIADIDQSNFAILATSIVEFCQKMLKKEGFLVMKYFDGASLTNTKEVLKKHFRRVGVFKPSSSKKVSNEIYLVCNSFEPLI